MFTGSIDGTTSDHLSARATSTTTPSCFLYHGCAKVSERIKQFFSFSLIKTFVSELFFLCVPLLYHSFGSFSTTRLPTRNM